ncbi:MAG TPA: DUF389 domain-containing protein [Bellilinea sp.]
MSLPTSEPIPSQPDSPSAVVRRRRIHRALLPQTDDERSAWLESVSRQLTPSFDYFLASLLSGIVLAIGLLLFSDALLVLGVLFAPFLGPVIGIALGSTNGTARLLLKSILSLAAAGLFIFGFGALAGALLPLMQATPPPVFTKWTTYEWPNFVLLAVGVGLSIYMLARSPRQRPLVANIAIAYGLFPPLSAAGINLVVYHDSAWIAGIRVAGVHLAWAVLVGIFMLILMKYPPRNLGGFLFTGLLIGVLVAAFMNSGGLSAPRSQLIPTAPAVVLPANPSPSATVTLTVTPQPSISHSPTVTLTPTITFEPTGTATETITPQPTPVWARVTAPTGGGALLRDEPDGKIISSILNGGMVQVISDPVRGKTTTIWVQVRTEDGLIGWIVQSLLATATPAPGW